MLTLLGLDIGTTTISAVVINGEDGSILHSETVKNGADINAENGYNRIQDVGIITQKVLKLKNSLTERFSPISAVGVTGQMHGILYIDDNGKPISPLYTWQDKSGELSFKGTTFAKYLSEKTGYNLSSGFGIVTDYALKATGKRPKKAAGFTTIHDYIVMELTGRQSPLMHISDAASLGCFSIKDGRFDLEALDKTDFDQSFLPQTVRGFKIAGKDSLGIPVAVAIGDNQASFLGSVRGENCVLVNIGTGSQVSVITDKTQTNSDAEIRPLSDNKNLLVGAPLCGGRSFALLHRFFSECAQIFGGDKNSVYKIMDELSEKNPKEHLLNVDTRFCGTRNNTALRGGIYNISEDNFTPEQLTNGFLWGMVSELYELYSGMDPDNKAAFMVGSGNAVRKSRVLRGYLEEQFGLKLKIPKHNEEAAFGAALYAAVSAGAYPDIYSAQNKNVHYQ